MVNKRDNTRVKNLYIGIVDLLIDALERENFRDVLKKGVRIYLGYWGRSLYFFFGVQAFLTAALVMANRMLH